MAIIGNRVPEISTPESAAPARVVVKLKAPAGKVDESPLSKSVVDGISRSFPELEFRSYFTDRGDRRVTPESTKESPATRGDQSRYLIAETPQEKAAEVAERLLQNREVDVAYIEGGPTPPPNYPENDPLISQQGYFAASPLGIDVREGWKFSDGSNVGLVDLEQGWTLDHEDIASKNVSIISGINKDFHGHGTAVLGQLIATRNNNRGGIGIAPEANARVVSQWRSDNEYSNPQAIYAAVAAMSRGDVLLLEAQTYYQGFGKVVLPVEVEELVFDAIQYAVGKGIVVIEAAGNGSFNLDTFADVRGRKILNTSSGDYRDSGAIMVGAASSAAPHRRLQFSNFGSRVDCFAWGENVVTCGDGWQGNARDTYTSVFGGTSGASPIVTGAALLLQSWAKKQRRLYSPSEMRKICSDRDFNIQSENPASDKIGVMPDLKAIIQREMARDLVA